MKNSTRYSSIAADTPYVRIIHRLPVIILLAALGACDSTTTPPPAAQELSVDSKIFFGPVCSFGGIKTEQGLDLNWDGKLDSSSGEVTSTTISCNSSGGTGYFAVEAAGMPLAIPDNDVDLGAVSTITTSHGPTSAAFVMVYLDISHSNVADLDITLKAPDGSLVKLSSDHSLSGRDYRNTRFTNLAPTAITTAKAPFSGYYKPEASLAGLTGFDANATWTLHVEDVSATETGTLNSWALVLSDVEPNFPPIADAGPVQKVAVGSIVTLDGRTSWDLNAADTLSYRWSMPAFFSNTPSGSSAVLTHSDSATPSFIADVAGNYHATLVVNDGIRDSENDTGAGVIAITGYTNVDTATMPLSIPDGDPVTGAASSITITNGPASIQYVAVHLDITHPYNEDLDIWLEAPDGSMVELSTDNGWDLQNYTGTVFTDLAKTSITDGQPWYTGYFKPEGSLPTLYNKGGNGTWTLHVYDDDATHVGTGTLDDWGLVLYHTEPNFPPQANAGPNQNVTQGDTVTLDGSHSWDLNPGDTIHYKWTLRKPAGSTADLTNADTASPSFVADLPGKYQVLLVINDGKLDAEGSLEVTVTVGGL